MTIQTLDHASNMGIPEACPSLPADPVCFWRQDQDGIWETKCGEAHVFGDGGPHENRHRFCPYCGDRLQVRKHGRRAKFRPSEQEDQR